MISWVSEDWHKNIKEKWKNLIFKGSGTHGNGTMNDDRSTL